MSSAILEPGAYYIPSVQAWEWYNSKGGSAEFKARTISIQQDNLVQLTGLPGYWWKVTELSRGIAHVVPDKIEIPVPRSVHSRPTCVIEVPTHRLQSNVCMGNLSIEYESEEDEDCDGEDCTACSGDGCRTEKEPLTASGLLGHLLESFDHSAESYAEEIGADRSDVDTLYRDLLVLVSCIQHRA